MDYEYRQKQFLVPPAKLDQLGHMLMYGIRNVREAAKFPLLGFSHNGPMKPAHHAEMAFLETAKLLGIVLGVSKTPGMPLSYGELDVSQE